MRGYRGLQGALSEWRGRWAREWLGATPGCKRRRRAGAHGLRVVPLNRTAMRVSWRDWGPQRAGLQRSRLFSCGPTGLPATAARLPGGVLQGPCACIARLPSIAGLITKGRSGRRGRGRRTCVASSLTCAFRIARFGWAGPRVPGRSLFARVLGAGWPSSIGLLGRFLRDVGCCLSLCVQSHHLADCILWLGCVWGCVSTGFRWWGSSIAGPTFDPLEFRSNLCAQGSDSDDILRFRRRFLPRMRRWRFRPDPQARAWTFQIGSRPRSASETQHLVPSPRCPSPNDIPVHRTSGTP